MRRSKCRLLTLLFLLLASTARAQLEPIPEDRGATGLALALRTLDGGAIFMHTTAHPDDEDNGLLVLMRRGRGLRTALLTATRGDGGQNMIGPELFEALGILRSAELMAMHRYDRAEQYFTLAYEFGYSFSVEETFEKWGKEATLGDFVRILRTVRPDVIVTLPLAGEGGGQHHQAAARLTKEAFRAAADPDRFPEHIELGLKPWQPLKLYRRVWFQRDDEPDPPGTVSVDTGEYDPVLGRSYHQMGMEARSLHRCQSMSQLRALPGERLSKWVLEDAAIDVSSPESDLFDGVATRLDRWKDFVAGEEDGAEFLFSGIEELERHIAEARAAFDATAPWKTIAPLRRGLTAVRKLRSELASSSVSEDARYELDHRLSYKEKEFERALTLAHGLAVDPIAGRGEVTPGSELEVKLQVTHRSPEAVAIEEVALETPSGWEQNKEADLSARLGMNEKIEAAFTVAVAPDAELTRPYWRRDPDSDRFELVDPEYFGLPFRPPPLHSRVRFRSGEVEVVAQEPVQYRYEGPWVGTEKQKTIAVLPAVSLRMAPEVLVFPVGSEDRTRELSVEAVYRGSEAASGMLRLEPPSGWETTPAEAPIDFEREGQAVTVSFQIVPAASVSPGSYGVEAVARLGGREYREGFQTIAYHHIETRYLDRPARSKVQALDVKVVPVTVGYVMGVGDEVPAAIRQLGSEVVLLGERDLAEGDLSRYDLIITGIRAYLNRSDLRAYNHRLLEYVREGGTMVVQYNRNEWDEAQWGPYPAKISRDRISVEEAPVRILEPEHPLFRFPNEITEKDWSAWVQERGTYFLGERDERYRDLIASEDRWEYNRGEKRGMLVEARYGKGRWIYTGLGFFRQLPEGVPDAYKLFANLLSLPRAPTE